VRPSAQDRIAELEAALREIQRKVHAHNRGGDIKPTLRKEVREICEQALSN
jgi:hypothetical protein